MVAKENCGELKKGGRVKARERERGGTGEERFLNDLRGVPLFPVPLIFTSLTLLRPHQLRAWRTIVLKYMT